MMKDKIKMTGTIADSECHWLCYCTGHVYLVLHHWRAFIDSAILPVMFILSFIIDVHSLTLLLYPVNDARQWWRTR
jgi:hypothetical protein